MRRCGGVKEIVVKTGREQGLVVTSVSKTINCELMSLFEFDKSLQQMLDFQLTYFQDGWAAHILTKKLWLSDQRIVETLTIFNKRLA